MFHYALGPNSRRVAEKPTYFVHTTLPAVPSVSQPSALCRSKSVSPTKVSSKWHGAGNAEELQHSKSVPLLPACGSTCGPQRSVRAERVRVPHCEGVDAGTAQRTRTHVHARKRAEAATDSAEGSYAKAVEVRAAGAPQHSSLSGGTAAKGQQHRLLPSPPESVPEALAPEAAPLAVQGPSSSEAGGPSPSLGKPKWGRLSRATIAEPGVPGGGGMWDKFLEVAQEEGAGGIDWTFQKSRWSVLRKRFIEETVGMHRAMCAAPAISA